MQYLFFVSLPKMFSNTSLVISDLWVCKALSSVVSRLFIRHSCLSQAADLSGVICKHFSGKLFIIIKIKDLFFLKNSGLAFLL